MRAEEKEARTAEPGAERTGRKAVNRRASDDAPPRDREIATPAANESMPTTGPATTQDSLWISAALREYAEQSSLGLAIIDRETHVVGYANPAFRRMRSGDGAPVTSDVVERGVEAVLPPSVAARITALLLEAKR